MINPENYSFHRGLQCCILNRADLITGTGCSLPCDQLDLTSSQVNYRILSYS